MIKEELKKIAKSWKFEPSEKVLNDLKNDFKKMQKNFELLKKINIDIVEPMIRINNNFICSSSLREDIPRQGFTKKTVLKNASTYHGDFVTIKRVIK